MTRPALRAGWIPWALVALTIVLAIAGTQVVTGAVGQALFGAGSLSHDISLGSGWAINLTLAEYALRRTSNLATTASVAHGDLKTAVGTGLDSGDNGPTPA